MVTKEVIDPKTKAKIDAMSYESMLRLNRYAPVGEPLFQGVTGTYFFNNMAEKREEIGSSACVQASKNVGWDGP